MMQNISSEAEDRAVVFDANDRFATNQSLELENQEELARERFRAELPTSCSVGAIVAGVAVGVFGKSPTALRVGAGAIGGCMGGIVNLEAHKLFDKAD